VDNGQKLKKKLKVIWTI